MTVRLVLVSLVAALGLTIPGGPTIEGWVAATQNWMNARFADWDARHPQEADYVIISDRYEGVFASPRVGPVSAPAKAAAVVASVEGQSKIAPAARTATALPRVLQASPSRHRPAFTPIPVPADLPGIAFADELNRRNEGLGIVPPAVKLKRRTPGTPRRLPFGAVGTAYAMMAFAPAASRRDAARFAPVPAPAPTPARPPETRFAPIVVPEDPYGGIAYELNRRNEGLDIRVLEAVRREPAPPAAAVASFGPMEASQDLYFAGPIEPATAVLMAGNAGSRGPAPAFSPASTLDPGDELAVETTEGLDEAGDGFAMARTLAPVAARTFEPIEVGEGLYVGVAYELNRRNDGLDGTTAVAAGSARTPVSPRPPARELSRAVRLTGEAVYAWVSVLTGPALVTVSK